MLVSFAKQLVNFLHSAVCIKLTMWCQHYDSFTVTVSQCMSLIYNFRQFVLDNNRFVYILYRLKTEF